MKYITKLFLIVLIASGLYSCGEKEVELPNFSKMYNQAANPEEDVNYAIKIAKEENKRILLLVGGDWCPWCNAFDKYINIDKPKIAKYLHKNFVLVKVYYGPGNYNNKFFASLPRLIATPHFYVLESDGSTLLSQGSEEFEKGRSYDELKLMSFLQQWVKK